MWKLGRVDELFASPRDGVVRAARVKTESGTLRRAVDHLYPLEAPEAEKMERATPVGADGPAEQALQTGERPQMNPVKISTGLKCHHRRQNQ